MAETTKAAYSTTDKGRDLASEQLEWNESEDLPSYSYFRLSHDPPESHTHTQSMVKKDEQIQGRPYTTAPVID